MRTWVRAAWLALVIGLVGLPRGAAAHPVGISSFEARTDGSRLQFWFKLNGISVIHLLNRLHPGGTELDGDAVPGAKDEVVRYFDSRFAVGNDGKPCRRRPEVYYRAQLERNKVSVNVEYDCPTTLDQLEIRSTLFLDEDTPHQLLGTLRHKHALERYFFTGGERVAHISLGELKQSPGLVFDNRAPYRGASPPPGARLHPVGFDPKNDDGTNEGSAGPNSSPAAVDSSDAANDSLASSAQPIAARQYDAPGGGSSSDTDGEGQARVFGFATFLEQGVVHIFGGLDHVLFVLTLLVAVQSWRRLAAVLTAFTVAHSITLALGTFDLVVASPLLVEPIIAASIVYVAVENLLCRQPNARLRVAFGFGLVHGLGFSGVLRELGLPREEFASSLLAFNLGVELGQLAIVAPLYPLWSYLRRHQNAFYRSYVALNVGVTIVALWWVYERIFG